MNPKVDPIGFETLADGRLKVIVHQYVEDKNGAVLFDSNIFHTYAFENGLIKKMEISE